MTVSGGGGCPGLAVLRAVAKALSLAPDSVTLRHPLEVEDFAKANIRSSGPATPDNVEVGLALSLHQSYYPPSTHNTRYILQDTFFSNFHHLSLYFKTRKNIQLKLRTNFTAGTETVNCGQHRAETCELCPMGNGRNWCHGDCEWRHGKCSPKGKISWGSVTEAPNNVSQFSFYIPFFKD